MNKTLNSKLKKCDPEIQEYVKNLKLQISAFKKEIAKLQRQKVSLEAKNFSANKRIRALEIEIKKFDHIKNLSIKWEN